VATGDFVDFHAAAGQGAPAFDQINRSSQIGAGPEERDFTVVDFRGVVAHGEGVEFFDVAKRTRQRAAEFFKGVAESFVRVVETAPYLALQLAWREARFLDQVSQTVVNRKRLQICEVGPGSFRGPGERGSQRRFVAEKFGITRRVSV